MVDTQDILTRQRLHHVRTIELSIRLPSYDEEARTRLENEEGERRTNEVFTRTVSGFSSHLGPLSECAPDNRIFKIAAYLCSDSASADKLSLELHTLCQRVKSADIEA